MDDANALAAYQAEVARLVDAADDVAAEVWHSGGGIVGVRIEVADLVLFSTLRVDDPTPCWTGFDLHDRDYLLVAMLELQVRPFDHPERNGVGAATAEEMADEILMFCGSVLGRRPTEKEPAHE